MATTSLWGIVQDTDRMDTGVLWVSTAGHGGMMISYAKAKKLLSKKAFNLGVIYGNYVCYEEDCAWAIPCIDNEYFFNLYLSTHKGGLTRERLEEIVNRTIKSYYPELLKYYDDGIDDFTCDDLQEGDTIEIGPSDRINYIEPGVYRFVREYNKQQVVLTSKKGMYRYDKSSLNAVLSKDYSKVTRGGSQIK